MSDYKYYKGTRRVQVVKALPGYKFLVKTVDTQEKFLTIQRMLKDSPRVGTHTKFLEELI